MSAPMTPRQEAIYRDMERRVQKLITSREDLAKNKQTHLRSAELMQALIDEKTTLIEDYTRIMKQELGVSTVIHGNQNIADQLNQGYIVENGQHEEDNLK